MHSMVKEDRGKRSLMKQGQASLRGPITRGRFPGVSPGVLEADLLSALDRREIDRFNGLFHRHGASTIFFARMIPTVRTLISLPAGIFRMSRRKFLLWTFAGAGLFLCRAAREARQGRIPIPLSLRKCS